ncbi:MAG: class I SAM-dependent methyltransferase [bacterium]
MKNEEFTKIIKHHKSHFWYRFRKGIVREFISKLGIRRKPVLDIGCGTGVDMHENTNALGADIDFNALKNNPYKERVNCRIESLPFKEHSFNAVLTMDVLQHESVDIPCAVRSVYNVLKPGGYWLINVPAMPSLYSYHDIAVGNGMRFSRNQLEKDTSGLFAVYFKSHWNMIMLPGVMIARIIRTALSSQHPSDLKTMLPLTDKILFNILRIEHYFFRKQQIPAGLSIFYILRRIN